MAWSSEAISANELAWAADDKPMISSNALYDDITVIWVEGTTTGVATDSDDSKEGYPATAMFDSLTGMPSRTVNQSNQFTIVIDASSAPISFDWFGVLNHNMDSISATAVVVQIADDAAFTTRLQTVQTNNVSTTLSSDRRFANLVMDVGGATQYRFLNVPYARIQVTCSSNRLYIGELVLGRRHQQDFQPDVPFDSLNPFGDSGDHESDSGVITRSSKSRGGRRLEALFHHDDTDLQDETLAWWDEIEGGQLPFFYHDAPGSNPMDFYMFLLDEPRLVYPETSAAVRELSIEATEIGPEYFSQDP